VGPLCVGKQTPGEEHDTGAMWECPFFVPLPASGASVGAKSCLTNPDRAPRGSAPFALALFRMSESKDRSHVYHSRRQGGGVPADNIPSGTCKFWLLPL